MDILDILIAKKKSFTGETEKLVRQANEAMAAANEVAGKIEQAEDLLSAAQEVTSYAQEAASNLDQIQNNITSAVDEILDDKISSSLTTINENITNLQTATENSITSVTVEDNNTSSYKSRRAKVRKNNIDTIYDVEKNYTSIGQNEDGSMTQKAITNALSNQKIELETRINNISTTGGSGNVSGDFSSADEGSLVVVGENGTITASELTENDIIKTQIILGTYNIQQAVGIEIDYDNKTVNRIQSNSNLTSGTDFDQFEMYGGRKRCLVSDDGEILAFSDEEGYTEDGSLGQIMVYQPKFYYLRMPLKLTKTNFRTYINKEIIYISYIKQAGFSIHPLFLDSDNNELSYVLLSAYEGSAFDTSANSYNTNDSQDVDFTNDILCSIANVKPMSGRIQNLNVNNAEQLASNRGENWQLTNLAAESANQMLMSIEYNSLNLQSAFNKGITTLSDSNNLNISCLTGSTSNLGNVSGMASSSTQTQGNITETYSVEGKIAISYRGVENPYGNMWSFIGGAKIITDNNNQYLVFKNNQGENQTFSNAITSVSDWISYFGYDSNADWAFIPVQCQDANSALPVGDYTFINKQNANDKCCVIGGKASAGEYAGPFYYGMDLSYTSSAHSYGARLMYKPEYNSIIYLSNISKWRNKMGGE